MAVASGLGMLAGLVLAVPGAAEFHHPALRAIAKKTVPWTTENS